jgi:hypothetical protein
MTHPSRTERVWPLVRIAGAVLILVAAVAQLVRTVQNALAAVPPATGDVAAVVANFLSFFTIQSNIASAVVLIASAVWTWTKGKDAAQDSRAIAVALACVTTYMIVTGVVYNTLLRNVELPHGVTVWWSNEILHVVAPLLLVADLLLAPKRRALPWSAVGIIVIYPIVWVVYTLVRGPLMIAPATGAASWYPYPFLDPALQGGYPGVMVYVVVIAAAVLGAGLLVIWVGRRRAATRESRAAVLSPEGAGL